MNHFIKILLFTFVVFSSNAQSIDSLYQEVGPKGGVNNLAVKYYGIDFSKAQRKILKDKEIEFIFLVDPKGKVELSEINGTDDESIIDSLKLQTEQIEDFLPRIKNGVPESFIYFMKLVFPTYKMTDQRYGMLLGLHITNPSWRILNI